MTDQPTLNQVIEHDLLAIDEPLTDADRLSRHIISALDIGAITHVDFSILASLTDLSDKVMVKFGWDATDPDNYMDFTIEIRIRP